MELREKEEQGRVYFKANKKTNLIQKDAVKDRQEQYHTFVQHT